MQAKSALVILRTRWIAICSAAVIGLTAVVYGQAPVKDIFSAVSGRHLEEVKKLIATNKSLVDARDSGGKTPLSLLVASAPPMVISGLGPGFQGTLTGGSSGDSNDLQIASILLGAGANINASDRLDRTPLITAIVDSKASFAKFLIAKGANVNVVVGTEGVVFGPHGGETPLHAAVGYGQVETIALLVAKGAKVNAQTTDGNTPLHFAALYHQPEAAQKLLQLGANRSIKNSKAQTPLEAANAKGDSDLIAILSGTPSLLLRP